VIVSNEVGLGIVPATPLGRRYRDLLGRANALVAASADDSRLVVAGRTVALEPWT
jgi:adenosyl cobinamide kinase/adenosyl cobinamide phosphate guanylyltransferase